MTRFARLLMTIAALVAGAVDAYAQAKTIRMPTASGSERIFAILLPQSYDTSKVRYPVVYLFHGGGQDHTAFMARTAFPPMARKHEFIVVMPAADRNYSVLGPEAQGRYHDYVAGELVDYVDSHYRTIPTNEGRPHRVDDGTDTRGPIQRGRRVQSRHSAGRGRRRAQRSGRGTILLHFLRSAGLAAADHSRVRRLVDGTRSPSRVS
jgi:hypothetical protein